MLKYNLDEKTFENVQETELRAEHIQERHDLQKAIANSWELFKNELGFPNAFLIGQEIRPDNVTQDTLDLLAYDSYDSSLIVIELKRDKNKLQLLQALSYAAMVSRWDTDTLLSKIQEEYTADQEELRELITNSDLGSDIKVVLIAEKFDPEVILTADWLSSNYEVSVSAFALSLFATGDSNFLSLEQRYPLKELQETYVTRKRRRTVRSDAKDVEWQDVIPKLNYPFAQQGIELCQKIKAGEPWRRRFGQVRTNYDGFKWVSLNFRQKHINVYLCGVFDDNKEVLCSKFRGEMPINSWKDGLSCNITTQEQFDDLVKWLRLD